TKMIIWWRREHQSIERRQKRYGRLSRHVHEIGRKLTAMSTASRLTKLHRRAPPEPAKKGTSFSIDLACHNPHNAPSLQRKVEDSSTRARRYCPSRNADTLPTSAPRTSIISRERVDTTEDTMDAVDAGLLFLMGLNAIVWWAVWQRHPSRPRQRGGVWLPDPLWRHLAGLHQAVWARVGRLHRWAQRRPLRAWRWWHLAAVHSAGWARVWRVPRWAQRRPRRERCDTRLVPPCVLCGDARHTMQDHVRWPQAELAYRAHTSAGATATNGATQATGLPDT